MMDILANEVSIHEQFHDLPSFHAALERLMSIRNTARTFDRDVYCNRAFLGANPIPGMQMQRAIGGIPVKEKQRAIMQWLTGSGPFWDEKRLHDPSDWLEYRGDIVTDTAVGEAALRTLHGDRCGLVSITPSDWNDPLVDVIWRREDTGLGNKKVSVENWWDASTLKERLQEMAPPYETWKDFHSRVKTRFEKLRFTDDCFAPLEGHPFEKCAADRFSELLDILNRLAHSFDANGQRTPEGQEIYQQHFTGDCACFSDSSDTEKHRFGMQLTFPHPNDARQALVCTWHGKVRHNTLRLHFSWPVRSREPIYIVYAGPKITK